MQGGYRKTLKILEKMVWLSLHEITQKGNHRNVDYSSENDCLYAFWKFEKDLVWAREADLVRMKEYHN